RSLASVAPSPATTDPSPRRHFIMRFTNGSVFTRMLSTSRTALGAAAFTALIAGSSLTAQLQTQAHYPLLTDLLDATATYGPMTLYGNGVPAPALPSNGVCVNG